MSLPVRRGVVDPLAVAGVVLVGTLALRLRDPHQHLSWGLCPLRAVTGLDCPLCGGLRATNDLSHGDLSAALSSNLLFVLSIPLLLGAWVLWMWLRAVPDSALRGWVTPRRSQALGTAAGVVTVVFTVWRNTAWGQAFWA